MRVTSISIDAFRNLRELSIDPAAGVNVICGENGQGKTNLLEGIWMFTGGRSFRGAKDAELVPLGQSAARLSAEFFCGGRDNTAALRFGEKRGAKLNGIDCPSQQEQAGHFFAAVFSPAHLTLVKGGPAERRRALDAAICQLKP
ncbi:MAG: AAA family ATPase, partial [Oscillospiraceae bacterium]